jgi:hypothetical protein
MITSGPLSMTIGMSTCCASGELGTFVMPTVSAPMRLALRTAATVYGVVPDAAMPTIASSEVTSRLTMSMAASSSSSAPSTASKYARSPPAINTRTSDASMPYVGGSSEASSMAMRPLVPAPA